MRGRLVRVQSRQFQVELGHERFVAVVPKRMRYENPGEVDPVAVGDWVHVNMDRDPPVITAVEKRVNALKRPASGRRGKFQVLAANIDLAVIVLSEKSPAWKLSTIDRYLVMASSAGINPCICINKVDLNPKVAGDACFETYRAMGIPVLLTSVRTRAGVEDLGDTLSRVTSIVIGPSGTGKSSLINALDPQAGLRVGEVSERTNKGQHTTTWVELIPLHRGGSIIDSPGLRVLDLSGVPPEHLSRHFPEFKAHINHCQFRDCWHVSEPQCAVRDAVGKTVAPHRYDSYLRILESLESGQG